MQKYTFLGNTQKKSCRKKKLRRLPGCGTSASSEADNTVRRAGQTHQKHRCFFVFYS